MFKPLSLFNRNRNAPAALSSESDPFVEFHHEMNRLFDNFFGDFAAPSYFSGAQDKSARAAHIDIRETDSGFELEAELPGVDEDDVDVELNDNLLTIRGEKKFEKRDDDDGMSERRYTSFQRSMSLPFDVDPDAINAKFKNGVLKLTLPKPPELAARPKKIAINQD